MHESEKWKSSCSVASNSLWPHGLQPTRLLHLWYFPGKSTGVRCLCLLLCIWKTQQWPQDWKRSVFIPIPKKGNAKESSNYCTIILISYASKVILKILWVRFPEYMNWECPDVQAGFRKGRWTRDQIANIRWIMEKARSFRKTSALLTMPKLLTMWITTNCGKFFKTWEYQTTLPVSWETSLQVKKWQLEPDMEQWTDSLLGKEYDKAIYILSPCLCNFYNKAVYCHPVYLTSMLSKSCRVKCRAGWNHKLESRLPEEISTSSDMQMITTLMAESEKKLKNLSMKVKGEIERAGLKLNIQKT